MRGIWSAPFSELPAHEAVADEIVDEAASKDSRTPEGTRKAEAHPVERVFRIFMILEVSSQSRNLPNVNRRSKCLSFGGLVVHLMFGEKVGPLSRRQTFGELKGDSPACIKQLQRRVSAVGAISLVYYH